MSLAEKFESIGFGNFNMIESKPLDIHIMKKWFTFEQ